MLNHYSIKRITPLYSMKIVSAETTLDEILFHFYHDHLSECEVGDILTLIENDRLIQSTLLVVPYKEFMFLEEYK